jgi:hypothetical protein
MVGDKAHRYAITVTPDDLCRYFFIYENIVMKDGLWIIRNSRGEDRKSLDASIVYLVKGQV